MNATTNATVQPTIASAEGLIGKLALLEFDGSSLSLSELTDLAWEAKPLINRLLSAAPKREVSTIVSIAATKRTLDELTGTLHDQPATILPSSVLIHGLLQVRSTLIQHKRSLPRR